MIGKGPMKIIPTDFTSVFPSLAPKKPPRITTNRPISISIIPTPMICDWFIRELKILLFLKFSLCYTALRFS